MYIYMYVHKVSMGAHVPKLYLFMNTDRKHRKELEGIKKPDHRFF